MVEQAEKGEVCFRGRHIMMGYMAQPKLGDDHVGKMKEKLAGAIDNEGEDSWFDLIWCAMQAVWC